MAVMTNDVMAVNIARIWNALLREIISIGM
jgi:hypothetical protein